MARMLIKFEANTSETLFNIYLSNCELFLSHSNGIVKSQLTSLKL
jgi:hypothetical protein